MNSRQLTADDFNFVPIQVAVRLTGVSRERIKALATHGLVEYGYVEGHEDIVSVPSLQLALAAGYETVVTRSLDHSQVYSIDGVDYVTLPGAATLLGASVSYVDALIKNAKLSDTLFGARRFIRFDAIAEYQTQVRVRKRELRAKEKLLADVEKTQQRLEELLAKMRNC